VANKAGVVINSVLGGYHLGDAVAVEYGGMYESRRGTATRNTGPYPPHLPAIRGTVQCCLRCS
jgi:hypothetical protein